MVGMLSPCHIAGVFVVHWPKKDKTQVQNGLETGRKMFQAGYQGLFIIPNTHTHAHTHTHTHTHTQTHTHTHTWCITYHTTKRFVAHWFEWAHNMHTRHVNFNKTHSTRTHTNVNTLRKPLYASLRSSIVQQNLHRLGVHMLLQSSSSSSSTYYPLGALISWQRIRSDLISQTVTCVLPAEPSL